MRRIFVFAAAIAVTTSAFAQLDVVDAQGKKVGTATHTLSTAGGKITNKLTMKMSQQGASINMTMIFIHTAVGDPVTYTLNMGMTGQGSTMKADGKATFNGKKATIVMDAMGQKQNKTATAPGTVRDPSAVWVTGKVPAVGTKATYYQLDPMAGTFSKTTTTYHGLRDLKVGGKAVKAHCVATVEGTTTSKFYFTSKGELLKLESPQFNIVKR
ncbi:MAG: hypothetical protein ABIV13_03005 [Fimbriimonadales bacterium]